MGMDGRINRQRWWLGVIVLAVIGIVVSWILGMIFGTGLMLDMTKVGDAAYINSFITRVGWIGVITSVIFAYPYMSLTVKRRHDRGNNGYDAIGLIVLQLIVNLLNALGIGVGGLGTILGYVVGIYAIYILVVAGFLRGTAGPNQYGPDPLQG
jgi:uncharacterized membrane protein YhaH (DUF805 family)